MKELLILRHAKSDWSVPGLDDHDRPLNERGRRDAPRIGRLLQRESLLPQRIFSSTADRALTTAREVARVAGCMDAVDPLGELYLASPLTYLETVATRGGNAARVMLVGHNPTIEELILLLTRRQERMPTAALAWVELPIDDWRESAIVLLGELRRVWRPKELPDDL